MADQTISQLTELNGASLASNDLLPIVDTSSSETKKIQAAALIENGIALAASGSINLDKLDQTSTTKLDSIAIASGAINAGRLASNSAIAAQTTAPVSDNFNGRGWFKADDGNLQIYSSGAYSQVILSTSGIADLAITTGKIEDNAITDSKIQASGLSSSSIADGAVTATKIPDATIANDKLVNSTITGAKIALNTISGALLAAEAVGTASLASSGITSSKFAAGAVNTTAIENLAVVNDKIADATITYAKLNLDDNSVPGSKITSASISGLQIATNGILTSNLASEAVTGAKIASGTISAGKFAVGAIATADIADDAITVDKIADGAVGASQIASSGVTAIKLADDSSVVVEPSAPIGNGAFVGQQWFDSSTDLEYTWDGAAWNRQAAINTISFTDSTPLAFSVAYPDAFSASITTTLETQAANSVLIGPASGTASEPTFRTLQAVDLPIATASTIGAVLPGNGLSVSAAGVLNHSNSAIAGTYTGAITIDSEGHIVNAQAALQASDIPSLDASKITTGTFGGEFLAENSVTATQLADYGIAQISESAPIPEFAGQWWINPNDRSAYIWVGEVSPAINGYWLSLGYGSPTQLNLRFGGTYNASGNTVASVNAYGLEAGLTIGQPLSAPNTSNNGVYLIVTTSGVGVTPAPTTALSVGDWVLSQGTGSNWTIVDLGLIGAAVADQDVLVVGASLTPPASGIATQEAFNTSVWSKVQIATSGSTGIVQGSTEVVVASGTGIMSVGTIDDGTF